jgi:hypothetical protein
VEPGALQRQWRRLYGTLALGGTLGDQANGFGFASVLAAGLQNGSPDGIALVDNFGRVIQFLSYEGPMTATSGPAAGMTSTDIGVEEANSAASARRSSSSAPGRAMATSTGPRARRAAAAGPTWPIVPVGHRHRPDPDRRCARRRRDRRHLEPDLHRPPRGRLRVVGQRRLFGPVQRQCRRRDLAAGTALSGTVTFAAGEYVKTITLPVATDALGENNERLTVSLGNPAATSRWSTPSATGTILNDDRIT